MNRLIAEFEEQSFIQLVFPHKDTDWKSCLYEAIHNFVYLATTIAKYQPCVITCHSSLEVSRYFVDTTNLYFVEAPSNDTWARDTLALSVEKESKVVLYDFGFNGWGGKFEASLDNAITSKLSNFYKNEIETKELILEGGSIESNGAGILLTTSKCLLNQNRNNMDKEAFEAYFAKEFGSKKVLWLDYGELEGDDTDAHIDTLARFVDENTIAYMMCHDENDPHYAQMLWMEEQLKGFTNLEGKPFKLIKLPFPSAKYDGDERLPATYANFLMLNGAILVPTYEDFSDKTAIRRLQEHFPDREVIGVPCSTLIKQHGSLHCVTMQFPKGVGFNTL